MVTNLIAEQGNKIRLMLSGFWRLLLEWVEGSVCIRPSKLDCLFSVPARIHLRGRPQFFIIHYRVPTLKAAIFLPRKWQLALLFF